MKDIVPQVAAQTSAMEGQRRSVGMFMDGPVGVENGMVSACSSGGCCSSSIGMAWFGDIACVWGSTEDVRRRFAVAHCLKVFPFNDVVEAYVSRV